VAHGQACATHAPVKRVAEARSIRSQHMPSSTGTPSLVLDQAIPRTCLTDLGRALYRRRVLIVIKSLYHWYNVTHLLQNAPAAASLNWCACALVSFRKMNGIQRLANKSTKLPKYMPCPNIRPVGQKSDANSNVTDRQTDGQDLF